MWGIFQVELCGEFFHPGVPPQGHDRRFLARRRSAAVASPTLPPNKLRTKWSPKLSRTGHHGPILNGTKWHVRPHFPMQFNTCRDRTKWAGTAVNKFRVGAFNSFSPAGEPHIDLDSRGPGSNRRPTDYDSVVRHREDRSHRVRVVSRTYPQAQLTGRQVNLDDAASRFRFAKRRSDRLFQHGVELVLNEGQFTRRPLHEYIPTQRRSLGDQPDKFLQLLGRRFGRAHWIPMNMTLAWMHRRGPRRIFKTVSSHQDRKRLRMVKFPGAGRSREPHILCPVAIETARHAPAISMIISAVVTRVLYCLQHRNSKSESNRRRASSDRARSDLHLRACVSKVCGRP
jgi:hypothetical protein